MMKVEPSEVCQLYVVISIYEDIFRLNIPMDNFFVVDVLQRVDQLINILKMFIFEVISQ